MESISIRNMDLKYYVIDYLIDQQKCIYFIVSSNRDVAVDHFLNKAQKISFNITKKNIINVRTLDFINPN